MRFLHCTDQAPDLPIEQPMTTRTKPTSRPVHKILVNFYITLWNVKYGNSPRLQQADISQKACQPYPGSGTLESWSLDFLDFLSFSFTFYTTYLCQPSPYKRLLDVGWKG